MIITAIIGILAVFLAWLESSGQWKHGLKASLFVIFVFLAIRYDFGNDYQPYYELFEEIVSFNNLGALIRDTSVYSENGWKVLCWLFKPFGFFALIAFISGINIFLLGRFIKKYIPTKYYWFAIFLYFFTPGMMLIMSTAFRQTLATMLFIFAIDYLIEKKPIKYLFVVLVASTIHVSALILIVLVVLCFAKRDYSKIVSVVFLAIFVAMLVIPSSFINYFEYVIESANLLNKYSTKLSDTGFDTKYGWGFILQMLIYFVLIQKMALSNKKILLESKIFYLFLISLLLSYSNLIVHLSSRLSIYLFGAAIFIHVYSSKKIINYKARVAFIAIICINTFYQYFSFYQDPLWEKFKSYNTIFSVLF